MRQLANGAGTVTLARDYDPFGELAQFVGSAETDFGFTGELTDASGLIYLRARYYNPGDGRFISRDTWAGSANNPLSLNRWSYVQSNPVKFVDPSGHDPSCVLNPSLNMEYIEKYVAPFLQKSNWLHTYTAAGIAVQCWRVGNEIVNWFFALNDSDPYGAVGPGQISNKQASSPWGKDLDGRGQGLLCYIIERAIPGFNGEPINSCITICKDKDIMDANYGAGNYRLEDPHDLNEMRWAVEYMRRRIKLVTDACVGKYNCFVTDKYIAAALAQNGSGFTAHAMKKSVPRLDNDERKKGYYKMDWKTYFEDVAKKKDTRTQLRRFDKAIQGLKSKGWFVPDMGTVGTNYVEDRMK